MKRLPSLLITSAFLILCISHLSGEIFRYRFAKDDSWRINSVVRETVLQNRIPTHTAEITNRITVKVTEVQTAEGGKPERALYNCTFMTSEETSNRTFAWGREYPSIFWRDALGVYEIADEYFMPVVRNVPTFPEGDIKPGQSWSGTGEEVHDLRDQLGVEKPFKVPFTVNYRYEGPVTRGEKKLHLIIADYNLQFQTPSVPAGSDGPVSTRGYSKQRIYWDNTAGMIDYYEEDFRIQLELKSGTVLEFRGTAEAEVTESTLLDRDRMVKEINDEIAKQGIKDTHASANAEGVTISLENIQFEADSARLLPIEKEKITRIAALLERYPDKDLLISGHTALAGTAQSRQKLSEERADAVARFLIERGVRNPYTVFTRGFGAEKPIAPNDTEQNKARNRRVEITILEK